MTASPESLKRAVASDVPSPCDVMIKSTESLKRSHSVAFDEDSVEETLDHYIRLVLDELETSEGSMVSLHRLLELTRAQCNCVLWRGLGGPDSTASTSGCRWAMSSSDGVFFHAVNRAAEAHFGVRLRRYKGKRAQQGAEGCGKWHLPNVAEC